MLGGDEKGVSFKDFCWAEWKQKYRVKPPWLTKDWSALSRAIKVSQSEEIARAAWIAYLNSEDPFYTGHSPAKFLQSIDRWTVKVARQIQPTPQIHQEGQSLLPKLEWMAKIAAQVNDDPTIPESEKKNEMSRRWKAARESAGDTA